MVLESRFSQRCPQPSRVPRPRRRSPADWTCRVNPKLVVGFPRTRVKTRGPGDFGPTKSPWILLRLTRYQQCCHVIVVHFMFWFGQCVFFLSPVWLQSIGASYGAGGEPSAVVERKFRFRNVDLALDMAVFWTWGISQAGHFRYLSS